MNASKHWPANPRLQRTPSALPPSPLSRQPLGGGIGSSAKRSARILIFCVAVVAGGISAAAVASGAEKAASAPDGCYQINAGPWQPALEGHDGEFVGLPQRVRFTNLKSEWDRASFRVQPIGPVSTRVRPHSYWHPQDGGIFLNWTDGFTGVIMNLERTKTGFRGTAMTHWDATEHATQRSSVVLTRMECP